MNFSFFPHQGYEPGESAPLDQTISTPFHCWHEKLLYSQCQGVLRQRDVTGGRAIVSSSANQACRDRRLDYASNTTSNGHFIWKIHPLSECVDQSTTVPNASISSVPFYSSHGGYKVCLRLFLQGHGLAYGNYLSLAVMLMKGEYDSILSWPFPFKTELSILDQSLQGRDVRDEVVPDASEGFHRPLDEIKVVTLLDRFAPIGILQDASFVRDDAMYIRCHLRS